jgi:hypothetical protein
MKTYFVIIGLVLLAPAAQAQSRSNDFPAVIHAGGGVGYSQFGLISKILELGTDGQFTETKTTPAYTGYFDYQFKRHFSMGISGGVQSIRQKVEDFTYTVDGQSQTAQSFYYRLQRTNVGMTFRAHYGDNDKVDVYSGLKIGLSIFSISFDVNDETLLAELDNRASFATTTPSFQLILCGMRYYPIQPLGIHFELGIGAPAIVSAGLSLRIPTAPKASISDPD